MSHLEWAESQLAEIELLTSMFPTREELELTDPLALAELREYVEGRTSAGRPPPLRPQFLIKYKLDTASTDKVKYLDYDLMSLDFKDNDLTKFLSFIQIDFILSCAYPSEYPNVLPEITVR